MRAISLSRRPKTAACYNLARARARPTFLIEQDSSIARSLARLLVARLRARSQTRRAHNVGGQTSEKWEFELPFFFSPAFRAILFDVI